MSLRICALVTAAAIALGGCGAPNPMSPDATPEEVSQAAYRHEGPPALTLYTMVSNRTGSGAHTSLMINASERVIFDPAGSVRHPKLPERDDVLYGVTPQIADFYERAHARETYHVVIQRLEVSPEVAERALLLAKENGAVASAFCTNATSRLLSRLPGFESIDSTFFPLNLMDQFEQIPGVETRRVYDDDSNDKREAIQQFGREPTAS